MYKIVFTKQALKDLEKLKRNGSSKKARNLINVIKENPFQNPPKYEKLVGNLDGVYSRRINIQHRLVYQIEELPIVDSDIQYDGIVKVIRMWTHYEK